MATTRVIRRELLLDDSNISDVIIGGDEHVSATVTFLAAAVVDWVNQTLEAYNLDPTLPPSRIPRYQIVGLAVLFGLGGNITVLQLCVVNRCLIYQLGYRDSAPEEFSAFHYDARFCFVGCDINFITDALERAFQFSVRHTMDLGIATRRQDLRHAGLEELARELIHLNIEKPDNVRRSSW